jgi:Na+-transporting NADH:ubiquinone oxidoreductase subunit C
MAIDKDSNAFTFLFAGGLVVVVGAILASVSMGLKPFQVQNVQNAKMQDILQAANVKDVTRAEAKGRFMSLVKKRVVVDSNGKVINTTQGDIDRKNDSTEAFNINPRSQLKNIGKENVNRYALFVLEKDGKQYYVIPMAGSGLWGPIWGYIALRGDMKTVEGAVFDHEGETPGLGAEIATKPFQKQFNGKKVFDENGEFVSVKVVKGKISEDMKEHAVDGITGGTVTSNGTDEMIERTVSVFEPYFKEKGLKTKQAS